MPLAKYKFLPKEKLPAVNVNSINPDSMPAQAVGLLTGGVNPSAFSVFETLRAGSNDGKFKASIDGVVYDNIAVDLNNSPSLNPTEVKSVDYGGSTETGGTLLQSFGSDYVAQAFNSGLLTVITAIEIKWANNTGNNNQFTYELRQGNGPAGTLLGSKQNGLGTYGNGLIKITFDTPIAVLPNTVYTIKATSYRSAGGDFCTFTGKYSTNTSLNYFPNSTTGDTTKRLIYNIYSKNKIIASLSDVAVCVQMAIRAVTSKLETFVFNTNKFILTSVTAGQFGNVLKLMSPSSGTNISGAGGTPYLDMAANAVETPATGEDYNLIRLDSSGKVPKGLTHNGENQLTSGRVLGTVYQNTSKNPIIVSAMVNFYDTNNAQPIAYADIGPTNTPAIRVSYYKMGVFTASMTSTIFFIVPPNYYFKVDSTAGGSYGGKSIVNWFECDLV